MLSHSANTGLSEETLFILDEIIVRFGFARIAELHCSVTMKNYSFSPNSRNIYL